MIEHYCFAQSIQTKLGRIVSCPTSKRILTRQAADVDDVARSFVLKAQQGFPAAIENPRQIGTNGLLPLVHSQLRRALKHTDTRVVD